MAVKWLREKCLFFPVWPPWRAPRRHLTLAHPAIFGLGLGLVLRLGQYGRPSQLQLDFLFALVLPVYYRFPQPRVNLQWRLVPGYK